MGTLIVKDNALIEASYSLDMPEQRLILLAILEAREKETVIEAGSLLRIHASSYINQFHVEKHTAYKVLKEAVNGLFEQYFSYLKLDIETGKVGRYKSRWVDKIGYIDDLGCVELVFASDVIPLITRLEERFTEYDIHQISGLQSRYAIRLYELIIQWRSTQKTPVISLNDLRVRLGLLPEEYVRADNFKRRVLDLAIKQINEYTDIIAEYEQHKQGRNITGFTFKFKRKSKPKADKDKPTLRDVNTADMFTTDGLSDAQLARIAKNPQFITDYNHLVSPQSPAGQGGEAWVSEMVKRLKLDPKQFSKKPIRGYLEY